jgi:DNA-binding TFAR19-related protein (PDSD5 family)
MAENEKQASGRKPEKWEPKLERSAVDVLVAIAARINRNTLDAYPGYETIAADTGLGTATVRRQIAELERIKLLQVTFRKTKRYKMNIPLIRKCAKVVNMVNQTPWPVRDKNGKRDHQDGHDALLGKVIMAMRQGDQGDPEGDHGDFGGDHDDQEGDHHDHRTPYTEPRTTEQGTQELCTPEFCTANSRSDPRDSDISDGSYMSRIQRDGQETGNDKGNNQPALHRSPPDESATRASSTNNLSSGLVEQVEQIVVDLIQTGRVQAADETTRTNVIKGLLKQAVQDYNTDDVFNAVMYSRRPGSGFDWTRYFKREWYKATIEQLMRLRGPALESEEPESEEPESEGLDWIIAALR